MSRFFASLLLAFIAVTAHAETPPIEEHVDVHLLTVEVSVFDASGRPVHGLTAKDFVARLDRKPVAISYLDEIDRPAATEAPTSIEETATPATAPPPAPTFVVVVVDTSSLGVAARRRGLDALRDFVLGLAPHDQVMLIRAESEARIVRPYTSSREALLAGLSEIDAEGSGGSMRSIEAKNALQDVLRATSSRRRQTAAAVYAREEEWRVRRTLEALEKALDDLAGQPGRRALVLLSSGFEFHPGATVVGAAGGFYAAGSDLTSRLLDAIRTANRDGVTVSSIDPVGLGDQGISADLGRPLPIGISSDLAEAQAEPLRSMAADTGGVAVVGTNDLEGGLGRIRAALESYYLLSLPLAPGDDVERYRRLEVHLVDGRGRTVSVRNGVAGQTAQRRIASELEAALLAGRPAGDLPVTLEVAVAKRGGFFSKWVLGAEVSVPHDALLWTREGDELVAHLSFWVELVDDHGRRSELQRRDWTVRGKEPLADVVRGSFQLESRKGNQRVLVAVRDEAAGRAGSSEYPIRLE